MDKETLLFMAYHMPADAFRIAIKGGEAAVQISFLSATEQGPRRIAERHGKILQVRPIQKSYPHEPQFCRFVLELV